MNGKTRKFLLVTMAFAMAVPFSAASARAQQQTTPIPPTSPEEALSEALSAACRQDASAFSIFLTTDNAAAFRALPLPQRTAFMKRFVLLDDPGKPLLATSAPGRPVMRCESPGSTTEMRFGVVRSRENLSYIPVEVPIPDEPAQSITFGLVRESGNWKLLSIGLLLLDIPALARQWEESDIAGREAEAVAALRKIAVALEAYKTAYDRLPEGLDQLGPAGNDGASPDHAGYLDEHLAASENQDYRFRYSIVPASEGADEAARGKSSGFALAATPAEYGKTGRRSFYLDSSGALRGADKQGAVATSTDPRVDEQPQ